MIKNAEEGTELYKKELREINQHISEEIKGAHSAEFIMRTLRFESTYLAGMETAIGLSAPEREIILKEIGIGFPLKDSLEGMSSSKLEEKLKEQLRAE